MATVKGVKTRFYLDNSSWEDILASWDLTVVHGPFWPNIVNKPTSTYTTTGNLADPDPPEDEHQISFTFDLIDEVGDGEVADLFSVGDEADAPATGKKKCTCDWDIVLREGCQCGGK